MGDTSDPTRKKELVPSLVVCPMLNSSMRMKVTLWVHKVWETIEPVLGEIIEEAKLVKKFLKGKSRERGRANSQNLWFSKIRRNKVGSLPASVEERRRDRKVRGKRKSRRTFRRRKRCRNDDGLRVVAQIRNQNRSRTIFRNIQIGRKVSVKMSEGEGGRGRIGREGRERREGKRRKREIEKKRKKKEKEVDGDKKRKRKEMEKKSEKGKKGAVTDSWGRIKYMEADMLMMHELVYLNVRNVELNKFEAYSDGECVENKQVEVEHVPVSEQKADMRDFNGVKDLVEEITSSLGGRMMT